MTIRESKGTVRKKATEPVAPGEETAKKISKGSVKTKTSRMSSPAEVAGKPCAVRKNRTKGNGGVRKDYLTSTSACRLTFRLPKDAAGAAGKVTVVGDFNDWDREASPMKKLRNGDFETTLELPAGKEYRFRYLIDGHRWENDWRADKYEQNPYGCDDSVVIV